VYIALLFCLDLLSSARWQPSAHLSAMKNAQLKNHESHV
jgi:hypothetical protein